MTGRRYRRYPRYEESGVEWLGVIPIDWQAKPFKAILRRNDGGVWGDDASDDSVVVLRSTEQTVDGRWAIKDPARRRLSQREKQAGKLAAGDLVVTKSSGSDLHIGKTTLVDDEVAALDCCFSNFMQRLRLSPGNVPRYFWYLLNCPVAREQFVYLASTTTGLGNLSGSLLAAVRVPVPPSSEQRSVAAFLDRETAKIDGLVAKKERLIALLQEKRTALITRAVTRGLDPNVPMKDSDVEWLEEIPAHWTVKPLKSLSRLQTGLTLGKTYAGQATTSRPYLRVANVQDGYLALDDIAEVELPAREVERYELRAGDVLMTEGGDFDKLGRGYVWEGQIGSCLHQNHIFAVRPRSEALKSRFLALTMSSGYGRAYFTATSKQSTNLASTNSTKLRSFPMPLPEAAEQAAIVNWIDREAARLDKLTAKVQQAIARLNELRTALISAAVTGKIDVRGETAA